MPEDSSKEAIPAHFVASVVVDTAVVVVVAVSVQAHGFAVGDQ
jgi:hypothetical protein